MQVSIYGLFTVQSFYLPFVFLAISLLKGGWQYDVIGLLVGHLYFYLKRLHPRQGGRDLLVTPLWLRRIVSHWGIGAPPVQEANMHPSVNVAGFRPFSGRGRRL